MPYVLYGAILVVWVASILRSIAYRKLGSIVENSRSVSPDYNSLPALSVIITSHNQCDALRRNLPLILNQIYPQFEVIVVDINSTDATKQLLEKLEEDYPMLRHTFTPSTSRDISPQRLAITLGAKSTVNTWLVITQANCTPISHQWLLRLGEAIASHRSAKMAIGYTRYDHAKGYTERRMRFYHFWRQMLNLNFARKHGAYQCDGTNLVYNKELFFSHQGFASHSTLLAGATDIMVNSNSTRHNTTICLHPEAIMEQQIPSRKHWKQDRIYFQETKKHFKRTFLFRLRYAGSKFLHSLLVICMISAIAFSVFREDYIYAGAILVLWFIHFIVQGATIRSSFKTVENKPINAFRTAWFIHLIPFWDTYAKIRHTFSNKQQYRKKYI